MGNSMNNIKPIAIALGLCLVLVAAAWAGDEKTSKAQEIQWLEYDEGLAKAKAENKPLFTNFTATWCGWCKKMNKTTFKDPQIVQRLSEDFVAVKVFGDSNDTLNIDGYVITEKNLAKAEFKVQGYPTYWFLNPGGEKLGYVSGFQSTTQFNQVLDRALTAIETQANESATDKGKTESKDEDK